VGETSVSDAKAAWLQRVLGVTAAPTAQARDNEMAGVTGTSTPTSPSRRPADALAGWQAARATAMTTLRALEAAVRQMDVPERDRAVILLRAIQANLTEAPATPRQVAELQRYIETDDIVAEAEDPNGFGITVALRQPLLAALATLRDAQAQTEAA
jgi:hypothetical protein